MMTRRRAEGKVSRIPMQCAVSYNARPLLALRLARMPGFWCLITLLVLSRGPASAEWVPVEQQYQSPGLQTVYVDPANMRREGNLVALWQLTDYTWMQGGRKSTRFLSTKTHKQFDCVGKSLRLLAYREFLGHMGTGRQNEGYVDEDHWLPVKPDSIDHDLWEVACSKE